MTYVNKGQSEEYEAIGKKLFHMNDYKNCVRFFAMSSLVEDLADINIKPEKPPTKAGMLKKLKTLKESDGDKGDYLDKTLPFIEALKEEDDEKYLCEALFSTTNFRTMWKTFVGCRVFAVLARIPEEVKKGKDGSKKLKGNKEFKEPKKEDLEVAFSTMLNHCWNSITNCHMRMEQFHTEFKPDVVKKLFSLVQEDLTIKNENGKYSIDFVEKKKNKEIKTTLKFDSDEFFTFEMKLSQIYTWKVRLLDNIIAYKKELTSAEVDEQRALQLEFLDKAEKLDPKNVLIQDQRAFIFMQQKKYVQAFQLFTKSTSMIKLISCHCLLMKNLSSDEIEKEEMMECLKLYEVGKTTPELFVPSMFSSFKYTLLSEICAAIEEIFCWYYESTLDNDFVTFKREYKIAKICANCEELDQKQLSFCTECKRFYYCSKEYQKEN
jgi:hypothetical protein